MTTTTTTATIPGLPQFLRIEEAAQILQIGRTTAYEQANRYLSSGGQTGLPAVRIGRAIRVPAAAIEAWAAIGREDEGDDGA